MKDLALSVFFAFSILTIYSQAPFLPGQIYTSNGDTILAQIKFLDWKNTPQKIEYKTESSLSSFHILYNEFEFFEIFGKCKYVKHNAALDLSSNQLKKLGHDSFPIFTRNTNLFKVLIEGEFNLLKLTTQDETKYFYSKEQKPLEQLINKRYINRYGQIEVNDSFVEQLVNLSLCSGQEVAENIQYYEEPLSQVFAEFNKCIDSDYSNYTLLNSKNHFRIKVNLGIKFSNSLLNFNKGVENLNGKFGTKPTINVGSEFEYVIPHNREKLSLLYEIVDLNYSKFNYRQYRFLHKPF